ncbi:MAG TPA: hypothetical protein VFN61_06090 [Acidimicrobiales bacterium]|nr:hypothetical protein [Acidimicrobiales bacterium]
MASTHVLLPAAASCRQPARLIMAALAAPAIMLSAGAATASASARPAFTSGSASISSLDIFVREIGAIEARAGAHSAKAVWPANISERSQVVRVNGVEMAVAAFSFDPRGRPVKILAWGKGAWRVATQLPVPRDPFMLDHPSSLYLFASGQDAAIIARGSGARSSTEFFIPFGGAGCLSGAVVTNISGSWQYATFAGPAKSAPSSQIVGGNPRFVDQTIVTDNDCGARALSPRYTYIWAYNASRGIFTATTRPGWPSKP